MTDLINRIKKLNERQLNAVCCLKIKNHLYPESKKFLSQENIKLLNQQEKRLNDDWARLK